MPVRYLYVAQYLEIINMGANQTHSDLVFILKTPLVEQQQDFTTHDHLQTNIQFDDDSPMYIAIKDVSTRKKFTHSQKLYSELFPNSMDRNAVSAAFEKLLKYSWKLPEFSNFQWKLQCSWLEINAWLVIISESLHVLLTVLLETRKLNLIIYQNSTNRV